MITKIISEISPGVSNIYVLDRCFPPNFENRKNTLVLGSELTTYQDYEIPQDIDSTYLKNIAYLNIPKIKQLDSAPRRELSTLLWTAMQKQNIVAEWDPKDRQFKIIDNENSLFSAVIGEEEHVILGVAGPQVNYGYKLLQSMMIKYILTLPIDAKR